MEYFSRHRLIAFTLLVQLIALPILLVLTRESQNSQGKAASSTSISFAKDSTINNPENLQKDEYFSTDIVVDPGQNVVMGADIEISYDPTKVELVKTLPILINTAIFPKIIKQPEHSPGKVDFSVSVTDSANAVSEKVKVATLYFKAIDTAPRTYIYFGDNTGVFGLSDPNINILESSVPQILKISTPSAQTQTPSFSNIKAKK